MESSSLKMSGYGRGADLRVRIDPGADLQLPAELGDAADELVIDLNRLPEAASIQWPSISIFL
jgi:hypothetical protein